MISFEDLQKVDLRVGLIENVDEIEGKDKLFKLSVSFGEEKRIVVAGLKFFYNKGDLLNKKAVFVYNLAPIVLAGIESQAMILAAKNLGNEYKVFFADDSIKPGTKLE
jgi:methionine--tRNA ligase beta chain